MLERVTALLSICPPLSFFFNDTATTEIYTLSLHDALPISDAAVPDLPGFHGKLPDPLARRHGDRKSTRLNSSHSQISYAGFCLKKEKILSGVRAVLLGAPRLGAGEPALMRP